MTPLGSPTATPSTAPFSMVVTFNDLTSAAGLKYLDEYLLSRSYISGYQPSNDDIVVHTAISKTPPEEFINLCRWSFVFGDGVGVIVEGSAANTEEKVPTSAAARANFFDDEDASLTAYFLKLKLLGREGEGEGDLETPRVIRNVIALVEKAENLHHNFECHQELFFECRAYESEFHGVLKQAIVDTFGSLIWALASDFTRMDELYGLVGHVFANVWGVAKIKDYISSLSHFPKDARKLLDSEVEMKLADALETLFFKSKDTVKCLKDLFIDILLLESPLVIRLLKKKLTSCLGCDLHVAELFLELLETAERVVAERVSESGAAFNYRVLDRVVADFYHMILAMEVTENRVGINMLHLKSGLRIVDEEMENFHPDVMRNILDITLEDMVSELYYSFSLTFKGLASLEAKRKFRAPRTSPSCNSSPCPIEHVAEEAVASKICTETPSPLLSEKMGNVSLPSDPVEDAIATEVENPFESPRHGKDIFFLVGTNYQFVDDSHFSYLHDMKDMKDETRSSEHTSLQQPKHSIHRPCLTQLKEHEVESARDAVEGKTRKESRKVIVRSSYFQHKTVNINDQENKQDGLVRDNLANDICNHPVPESAVGNRYSIGIGNVLKRKKTTNDSVQEENVKFKHICTDTDEGKFGSNISHLGNYSDIAEKSMEKFVSMISSFRYSSSGSRASGLRAPLKDVRNTSNNRSTVGVDFSQFAYAPKNHKT
ncbi:hypothetical protein TIFTF001_012612 [Ficus carica]|uniref:Uncharacterized protein n=1 Tax=Ficus carica TaxID=3494 RepID=A0AA88DI40_FICCA|nr:hypothetical protein TIFTF001_012612 [Ficus carica]